MASRIISLDGESNVINTPIAALSPGTSPELLVIALGAGSQFNSHVNDGGFWFTKEYLNLSVPQALKTWTWTTCVLSLLALGLAMLLDPARASINLASDNTLILSFFRSQGMMAGPFIPLEMDLGR